MEEENYYLYVVTKSHPKSLFFAGNCGVGRTFLGPGVRDCLYGVLYVFPRNWIDHSCPGAETIMRTALDYYFGR